jgi:hypothetical protein
MHNVQIELDDILYDRYKELAKKDRRSVRSYITKMVIDYLNNHNKEEKPQGGGNFKEKSIL